jgi:hypothetical protein
VADDEPVEEPPDVSGELSRNYPGIIQELSRELSRGNYPERIIQTPILAVGQAE